MHWLGTRLTGAVLIAAMAVGSVLLWIGIPVGWVYIASQLVNSSQPSMGPYLLVIVGIGISIVIVGKGLAMLDRAYGRIVHGSAQTGPRQLPWNRSLRGERNARAPLTVLGGVMIWSVSIAAVAFGIWFFGFAGSSLPGT
ncbi:MAG TPA: hypothetical protein VFT42_08390 [Solirubrobacteraceae bacterium]|nr:hypothetical protein [Solirubrobacteraceae bacterium]